MGVCSGRLKNLITLPRRAANGYGSLQAMGFCRRREFAGDGSLQGMVVCRLRLKIIITLPRRAANAYGSLQAKGVCRRWEFAGDGCLQAKA